MAKYFSLAALMFTVYLADPQEWAAYSFQDLIFSHMLNDRKLVPALNHGHLTSWQGQAGLRGSGDHSPREWA